MQMRILGETFLYTTNATYMTTANATEVQHSKSKEKKKCVNYYEHSENSDLHYIFIVDTLF